MGGMEEGVLVGFVDYWWELFSVNIRFIVYRSDNLYISSMD